MEYTVAKLAAMAGVSARTLRWYDRMGLLIPGRLAENGYRLYGPAEVDRLQQILLYKALDLPLPEIRRILDAESFARGAALQGHLNALHERRGALEKLILSVEKTILNDKGETEMSDAEKFEGFKKKMVADNERRYGAEIREKYGDESVDASNRKVLGMTKTGQEALEALNRELNKALKAAALAGDPQGPLARKAADLHRQWLSCYWPEYSREAHLGVVAMYTEDARFTAYYEGIMPGCATFLRKAVEAYLGAGES